MPQACVWPAETLLHIVPVPAPDSVGVLRDEDMLSPSWPSTPRPQHHSAPDFTPQLKPLPALTFGLTNDDEPLLLTTNINLEVDVYDVASGEYQRTLSGTGAQTPFLIHGAH